MSAKRHPMNLQRKLNRLKAINTEYGGNDFVFAEANRVNGRIELPLAVRRLCGLSYSHQHFTIWFALPRQAPDDNHLRRWDFHAAILRNRGMAVVNRR